MTPCQPVAAADPGTAAATPRSKRPDGRRDPELRGTSLALRSIARCVLQLSAEERELRREIETITRTLAPQLLEQQGSRTPLRRAGPPRLVTARPHQIGSSLRPTRGRRPDPRLLRAKPSATGSTAAATANSTAHYT